VKRLFVAVWPPEEVLDRLAGLPRPSVDGLRWTDRQHWHVTLRFLGPVETEQPVIDALSDTTVGAQRVMLGPALGRFGHRILHVPVAGLDPIAAAVTDATAHLGRPPDDRPFRGHITLARAGGRARVDLRPLTGHAVGAEWEVDAVGLVESRLSSVGAHYEVLRWFPLKDR
jgi:2'-5' RNA ligase